MNENEISASGTVRDAASRLTPARIGLLAGAVAVVALSLFRFFTRSASPPLPVLFDLPAFSLIDQEGRSFGRDDLFGKVWVADFIFTRCPGICPILTQKLKRLSEDVGRYDDGDERVRFLSVSVDPSWDTPEKLRAYAVSRGVDLTRWAFLTGEPSEVRRIVEEGFHMSMGHSGGLPSPMPEGYDIPHGSHFVLVDSRGRIRGFFGEDPEGQGRLRKALKQLLEEENR